MAENPQEILMTEDGHPIGELVVAEGNPTVPSKFDEVRSRENRDELLRASAQEVTGNPDADAAVLELCPGYADGDKRRKAMDLIVFKGKTVSETAKEVGVTDFTVSQWMFVGGWDRLVRQQMQAKQATSVLELARLRADRRLEIAEEQLEQAKMIRDKAAKAIEDDEVSLKSGTEAWATAAKIEHTLTGVSETGTIADIEGKDEKKDAGGVKQQFVFSFNGGLPPKAVDV